MRPRLSTLSLTERRDEAADQLDLVITDEDGRMALPKTGAIIELELGWRGGLLVPKGRFKVDQVGHRGAPDTISIKARSADFTAAFRKRRNGSWRGKSLGQVLQEVAGRNGLRPSIAPALAALPLQLVDQSRESDAALLSRLGREHGAVATVKNGSLVFAPIGAGTTASGATLPGFEIRRRDGDQHDYQTAERGSYDGVEASWHDDDSGETNTVSVGGGDNAKRLRRTYASEASARRAATTEQSRIAREKAKFRYALALGRPELYPEQKGKVLGIKPEIEATTWIIDQLVHTLGEGLTTSIEFEAAT
ncbi:MAG: phage late control D family protein [Phenylobacterium sp.]|nr:phage late control D family protein [Phenylobacterium sp.]